MATEVPGCRSEAQLWAVLYCENPECMARLDSDLRFVVGWPGRHLVLCRACKRIYDRALSEEVQRVRSEDDESVGSVPRSWGGRRRARRVPRWLR